MKQNYFYFMTGSLQAEKIKRVLTVTLFLNYDRLFN